jgi:hypothetical protein
MSTMHKTMDTWNIMELWMHRMHEIMGQNMKDVLKTGWFSMVSQDVPQTSSDQARSPPLRAHEKDLPFFGRGRKEQPQRVVVIYGPATLW